MLTRSFLSALAVALVFASNAAAHFVWVVVASDSSGQPAAQVYFSELAEPDSADLLDKIITTKTWSRAADGQATELKLTKQVAGQGGWLTAPVAPETKALSAAIQYGVITRGDKTFLLNYAAKYLDSTVATSKTLARDEALTLDIVPHASDKGFSLEVLYRGKPVAGSEVVILDPTAAETEAKTDEAGRMELAATKPGIYSIRAKWVVAESGQEGDKKYAQVNHYCTLALNVPKQTAEKTVPTSKALTASELLRESREGRAVWHDFPGFQADLTLFAEGRQQTGKLTVNSTGEVKLSGLELQDEKPVLGMLRSMIGHRLAGSEASDEGSFADEQVDHPLGRLIKLDNDSAMASAYRVKDGVIREVNRQTDSGRFTITVFEVNRNGDGKYLPGYYTVNSWNKDGSLKSNSATHESWIRVGSFDLPATHASVRTGKDEHSNIALTFSNHQLLK